MSEQDEARAETIYPREHVGYKNPPPRGCGCDECFLNEARRMAYVAGCVDQAERMREGNAVVMQHAEDRVSAYKRQIRLDALRIASIEVDHAHLTEPTDAEVEAGARALCEVHPIDDGEGRIMSFEAMRGFYRLGARAVLSAARG